MSCGVELAAGARDTAVAVPAGGRPFPGDFEKRPPTSARGNLGTNLSQGDLGSRPAGEPGMGQGYLGNQAT